MFGLGMGELLLILVVALLAVGPDKLPNAARSIGKAIRDLRRQTKELQNTLEEDTKIGDAVRELKSALHDDPTRPPPRPRTHKVAAAPPPVPRPAEPEPESEVIPVAAPNIVPKQSIAKPDPGDDGRSGGSSSSAHG